MTIIEGYQPPPTRNAALSGMNAAASCAFMPRSSAKLRVHIPNAYVTVTVVARKRTKPSSVVTKATSVQVERRAMCAVAPATNILSRQRATSMFGLGLLFA